MQNSKSHMLLQNRFFLVLMLIVVFVHSYSLEIREDNDMIKYTFVYKVDVKFNEFNQKLEKPLPSRSQDNITLDVFIRINIVELRGNSFAETSQIDSVTLKELCKEMFITFSKGNSKGLHTRMEIGKGSDNKQVGTWLLNNDVIKAKLLKDLLKIFSLQNDSLYTKLYSFDKPRIIENKNEQSFLINKPPEIKIHSSVNTISELHEIELDTFIFQKSTIDKNVPIDIGTCYSFHKSDTIKNEAIALKDTVNYDAIVFDAKPDSLSKLIFLKRSKVKELLKGYVGKKDRKVEKENRKHAIILSIISAVAVILSAIR